MTGIRTSDVTIVRPQASHSSQPDRELVVAHLHHGRAEHLLRTRRTNQGRQIFRRKDERHGCQILQKIKETKIILKQFDFLNGPSPASFSFIFVFSNKHYNLLQQICEKFPYSIWCWDSNPQPSGHKFPPMTTRPGLPPSYR